MSVEVHDPSGAALDGALPTVVAALDPEQAEREFRRLLRPLPGGSRVRLRRIRVTRHKRGRRCVIEYKLRLRPPEGGGERLTLIGKVRAGRSGRSAHSLLRALWSAGFQSDSGDGISVPEPVGTIPVLRMALQRKVPGRTATKLLEGPQGLEVACRAAEVAHKLHRAGVPAQRRHTLHDELRVLRELLPEVARLAPQWDARIRRLLEACRSLAAGMPPPEQAGIHRDYYGDQLILAHGRVHLVDLDLYCAGDPALDIGNFTAHMGEQALRVHRDPDAMLELQGAVVERFGELTGRNRLEAVAGYETLTLARHVYLSTQLSGREHLTGALLELCEQRLDLASSRPPRSVPSIR